jgi:hypothetical protein
MAIISIHGINCFFVTKYVYYAVRTETLEIIPINPLDRRYSEILFVSNAL